MSVPDRESTKDTGAKEKTKEKKTGRRKRASGNRKDIRRNRRMEINREKKMCRKDVHLLLFVKRNKIFMDF